MLKSIRANKKGILIMLLSSICVCAGQLFWKLSAQRDAWLMVPGFCLYGVGALLMLFAYKFGRLSVLQPMLSMNYVFSILLAVLVLHESVSLLKCAGIATVIAGVILIAGSERA